MTTTSRAAARYHDVEEPLRQQSGDELREAAAGALRAVASEIESISDEQARWRPAPDAWCAAQAGEHVVLATGVLCEIVHALAVGAEVPAPDWDPPAPPDRIDLASLPARLIALAERAAAVFEQCRSTGDVERVAENAYYGALNWRGWFQVLRVHAEAHRAQIDEIRASPGFPGR